MVDGFLAHLAAGRGVRIGRGQCVEHYGEGKPFRQGLAATEDTGLQLYRPYLLALLAEAHGQAGQPEAGLTALAEACTLVEATEERRWEADACRSTYYIRWHVHIMG